MTEMVTYRSYDLGDFNKGLIPSPSPKEVEELSYGEWKMRLSKAFPNGIPQYLRPMMRFSNEVVVSKNQQKPNHYRLLLEALTQEDAPSRALQAVVHCAYQHLLPKVQAPYVHFNEIARDTLVTNRECPLSLQRVQRSGVNPSEWLC